MKNYNKNYLNVLESFGSILLKKRIFYPRNFNLSEKFTSNLKEEISRLKKEGLSEQKIIDKISKCIRFYC